MTFIGAGTTGSTGTWETVYEVDFSTLGNQDIKSDTTHTIDGITWNVVNSSSSTSMDVVNGTGLVLVSQTGSGAYGDNQRSSPLMHANIQQFFSDVSFGDAFESHIRLWVHMTFTDADENFEFFKCGFEMNEEPAVKNYVGSLGFNAGNIRAGGEINVTTTANRVTVIDNTSDVIMVGYKAPFSFETRVGSYSGGFPDRSAMTHIHSATELSCSNTTTNGHISTTDSTGALDVVMVIQPTGSSTTFTSTITNFRIERFSSG